MRAFRGTTGRRRSPSGMGLVLLLLNLGLIMGWAAAMTAALLLSLIGVTLPPWVIAMVFFVAAVCLWFWFGASTPPSFSPGNILQCMAIGLSPILLGTSSEYGFLFLDPEGCVGAHIVLLFLGTAAVAGCSVCVGLAIIIGRLRTRPLR